MSGGRDAQTFGVYRCAVCDRLFFSAAGRDGHQAAHTEADADREEVRTDGGTDEDVADSWTLTVELTLSPGATEYRAADVRDRLDRLPGVRAVREVGQRGVDADSDRLRTDGGGVPLAGDPPEEDARVDDLDECVVADTESGARYVIAVRSGELTLLANGGPREGVRHETPVSLWRKYHHGAYYAPSPERSPWPVLDRLVGDGRGSA